jgi:hypothetical protein
MRGGFEFMVSECAPACRHSASRLAAPAPADQWVEGILQPTRPPQLLSPGPPIHVPSQTALESLRATFAAIAQNASALSPQETEAVRRRVLDVVDELKAAGALPERIIVAIKKLAADVGIAWTGSALLEQIVNWSVERFYAHANDASAVPPR